MDYDNTENDEIANIYQKMVEGDKSALTKLQKVQAFSPKKKSSAVVERILEINKEEQKQPINTRKSQNFKNYVKQKVSELRNAKQSSKKQITKPTVPKQNNNEYRQSKPFSVQRKKNEAVSQKLVTVQTQNKLPKVQYKTNSVTKTKTSNVFQEKMKKNIIRDKTSQVQKNSSPPSSKNSFRVRQLGNNKKMIQQLMRINEEERALQAQILELHNSTKEQVQAISQKYNIINLQKSRMSKASKAETQLIDANLMVPPSPDIPQNSMSAQLKKISPKIQAQENHILSLNRDIKEINSQLEKKKNKLSKIEAKIQMSPLLQYMNAIPDIFEEQRESEEENQQVKELPQNMDRVNNDPTRTYHTMMNERRKKNWGLNKRINYEYDSIKSETASGFMENKQPQRSDNEIGIADRRQVIDNENKVVVNSRLKQFLFD